MSVFVNADRSEDFEMAMRPLLCCWDAQEDERRTQKNTTVFVFHLSYLSWRRINLNVDVSTGALVYGNQVGNVR